MQKFKRVVLKLSGEALAGNKGFGFDDEVIEKIHQTQASSGEKAEEDGQERTETGE